MEYNIKTIIYIQAYMRAAYVRMNYRQNIIILFNSTVVRNGVEWRCKLVKFRWGDYVLLVWN